MINHRSDLHPYWIKPYENALGARSVEGEKQCQEPKVLPLPLKQVPVREDCKVSAPAFPGTSSRRERGIFEKVKGSGIWWIRYADASGKGRREKAGTKGNAIRLYQKRKTEALQGKKLPETIRRKQVFDLLDLAADYVGSHYQGQRLGADGMGYRYSALKGVLGNRPADAVTGPEIERALSKLAGERKWKPASFKRHKAFLSLAYRLGTEDGKLTVNPVRFVHRRREDKVVSAGFPPRRK